MLDNIKARITDRLSTLTKSEKKIANYLLSNPNALVLESAGSLAKSTGVSPMTVSRFFRKLGFDDITEMKQAVRTEAGFVQRPAMWTIGERYDSASTLSSKALSESLEFEIAGMVRTYELTETARWKEFVQMVAETPRIYVHGLQITRGLATEFAYRLEYVRPRVYLSDGHNGTYAEILTDDPKECCVILIDIHRYARATRDLAQAMKEANIPFFVVTDDYCHWARDLTDRVFSLPTATGLFWHSTATMNVLLNLLVNDVVGHLGDAAKEHIDRVMKTQSSFGEFLSASR